MTITDPSTEIWSAVGKPLTGLGAGRYKLDHHYLYFEKGMLSTNSQQVPIAAVVDVDVLQTMTQKARRVGTIVVHIQRSHGIEVVRLEDVESFREGQQVINQAAHTARTAILRSQNTHRYEGTHPGAAPVPAASAEPTLTDQLHQLGSLRDAGILTPEEFDAKKADLLSRI